VGNGSRELKAHPKLLIYMHVLLTILLLNLFALGTIIFENYQILLFLLLILLLLYKYYYYYYYHYHYVILLE